MRNETPYMAIVVTYEPVREAAQPAKSGHRQCDESWRELLTDQDMPLFDALRSWRGLSAAKKKAYRPTLSAPTVFCFLRAKAAMHVVNKETALTISHD